MLYPTELRAREQDVDVMVTRTAGRVHRAATRLPEAVNPRQSFAFQQRSIAAPQYEPIAPLMVYVAGFPIGK